jgi:fatty acid desaturase
MPHNRWYFQYILELLFLLLQPINMTLKLLIVPLTKQTAPDLNYAFPMLIFLSFWWSTSFVFALKLYLGIYCSFTFLLMKVLFCGHRVQDTWTAGCPSISDFGEHTLCATSDTDVWVKGIWSYLFLAGFNLHISHHMFPTADHEIIPKIDGILTQLCRERGFKKN